MLGHRRVDGLATLLVWAFLGCSGIDATLVRPGDGEPTGGTTGGPDAGGTGAMDTGTGATGAGGDGAGGMGTGGEGGMGTGGDDPSVDRCGTDGPNGEPPECERPNAEATCYEGYCYVVACDPDYRDCNLNPEDGCETAQDDVQHCGTCNSSCARPGAAMACEAGKCVFVGCMDGYADCDGDETNGCEVDIRTPANCGACGNVCATPPMGAPACVDGVCGVGKCVPGFGNCDGDVDNGCEQSLATDQHCGACGAVCDPARGTGSCRSGACKVDSCETGYADCNRLGDDGCEADLSAPESCGACDNACQWPRAQRYLCEVPDCSIDHSCPDGEEACVPDAPTNGCRPGYADCNGLVDDGCEVDLDSPQHCGGCGNDCRAPGTLTACDDGACDVIGCEPGFALCGSDGACISLAADDDNCGACGRTCGPGQTCVGGACSAEVCDPGFADCDPDTPGCEPDITTVDDCGACGVSCGPYAQATGACTDGGCTIGQCNDGFLDCDGSVANGCETSDGALANCQACGNDCRALNGVDEATCGDGGCGITRCVPGKDDCNGNIEDGCEQNLAAPTHCGACFNDCTQLANTTNHGCNAAGSCVFDCAPNYADCNGDPSDGCETPLDALSSCGGCGNDCSALANVASASCVGGSCGDITCEAGYADCDGLAFTGCEQSTRNAQNCGGCGQLCAPAGATSSSCPDGTCQYTCGGQLKDCNGDPADGCEADIQNDPDNCGGCGTVCDGVCNDGVCGCALDSHCGPGESCCDGLCVFTDSSCVWWPCIPGFNMPYSNCGACGRTCGRLACCRN